MDYNERIKLLLDTSINYKINFDGITRLVVCMDKKTLLDICRNCTAICHLTSEEHFIFSTGKIFAITPFHSIDRYPPLFPSYRHDKKYLCLSSSDERYEFLLSDDKSIPYGKAVIRPWNLTKKEWIKEN